MISRRTCRNLVLVATDIAAIYIGLIAAFYTRVWLGTVFDLVELSLGIPQYLHIWWIIPVVLASIAYHGGYGAVSTLCDDILSLARSFIMSFLLVWMVFSLQKEAATVSRIIITLSFFYMALLTPMMRWGARFFLFRILCMRSPALLFEPDDPARCRQIEECLSREWYMGYELRGKIRGGDERTDIGTCFIHVERADENTIRLLKPERPDLIIVSDTPGLPFMSTKVKPVFGTNMNLIVIRNGLLSSHNKIAKGVFDFVLATLAFTALTPLMALICLVISIDSRGPVIYKHRRCGKALKEFDMLKFRTMDQDGDRLLKEYLKENPREAVWLRRGRKLRHDPRVTRAGRLLRKFSLDELPQLVNVMKRQMSLVGPRPDSRDANLKYSADYRVIYDHAKPGITGLWQVCGRSEIGYAERVNMDYMYVLNWSPWLDLAIVLKTLRAVLSTRGAY